MELLAKVMVGIAKVYCQEQTKSAPAESTFGKIIKMAGNADPLAIAKSKEQKLPQAVVAFKEKAEDALVKRNLSPEVAKAAAGVACVWAAVIASAVAAIACPPAAPVVAGAWAVGGGSLAAFVLGTT